jgi:hypothetical protein
MKKELKMEGKGGRGRKEEKEEEEETVLPFQNIS